jgi:hypothetical protein
LLLLAASTDGAVHSFLRASGASALILAIMLAANGCTERRSAFTSNVFEAAKKACGVSDAYILTSDSKAIGFRGASPDHAGQARCLVEQLKNTDAKMVGFISEPPN